MSKSDPMSKSDRESILGVVLLLGGSALLWYLQGVLVALSVLAMIGGSFLMFSNGAMKDYVLKEFLRYDYTKERDRRAAEGAKEEKRG